MSTDALELPPTKAGRKETVNFDQRHRFICVPLLLRCQPRYRRYTPIMISMMVFIKILCVLCVDAFCF
jgi:hypothetical protein